jgi:predicted dehydrogenase
MQRRSYDLFQEGRKIVSDGVLGNVRMVRTWRLNDPVGNAPPAIVDGHLDWEQWQGPAKRRPFDANRFRNWRLFSDYSGGMLADQGAHVFDAIHMLMNSGAPVSVNASAGRIHQPAYDTPEAMVVTAEYPEDFLSVFTMNYATMRYQSRNDQMDHLDGDKARMDIGRDDCKVYLQGAEETPFITKKSAKGFGGATDMHVENFISCMKNRKTPTAPITLGFHAALVVQMANLSLRQGRRLRWDAKLRKVEA